VSRVAKGISDLVLVDTIGKSIGGIQRRRATHPFRCRRKANDVLGRGQTHRPPIHVYGNRSICRDHQWKPPDVSFNPERWNAELPAMLWYVHISLDARPSLRTENRITCIFSWKKSYFAINALIIILEF